MARWSDERYALDKRFVQLTLLLDQGEDAPGPRWQRGSETLHDLGEVLARVRAGRGGAWATGSGEEHAAPAL